MTTFSRLFASAFRRSLIGVSVVLLGFTDVVWGAEAPVGEPSAATKDNPWINSLEMRFIPIPGKTTLLSVWETRVKDFEAFVKATGRKWSKPPQCSNPMHPAGNVTWFDATAFCEWLTTKEQAEGKLKAGQSYRLPLDLEWSAAVGYTNRQESRADPSARSVSLTGTFLWGTTEWPPPPGSGNFCDDSAVKKHKDWTAIPGYRDGFAELAPVGSFPANAFGFYDLAGNVCEWCEDLQQPGRNLRCMRGASFSARTQPLLRAGSRQGRLPDDVVVNNGFRCALVLGAAAR